MLRTTAALFVVAAVLPTLTGEGAAASKPFMHPVVIVHAKEFAFIAPARIAAGTTTFRLVNDGKEVHQVSILELTDGKTLADYAAAIRANQPTPWAIGAGGPNAARPGQTIAATVTLEPGNYIFVCWVPSPGDTVPHMMKGMMHSLTVTAPSGVTQAGVSMEPAPEPDVRLEVFEYGFKFSKPLTAGRHTIQVANVGTQDHEAVMMKLAPGKTMKDVDAWFESLQKTPPPLEAMPGMAGLGKGRTGTFTTTLTPGRYAVACFIPDVKDGKPHAMHGMVQEITIAPK
jgi:uncharacterized cupredoxin-like copper-binding protein